MFIVLCRLSNTHTFNLRRLSFSKIFLVWDIFCRSRLEIKLSGHLRLGLYLRVACYVIVLALLSYSAFVFKIDIFKKIFQNNHQSVKQFGPRSGPTEQCHDLGPDLNSNFLQRLSADTTGRQRL